jgi:hypothetical protein
MVDHRAEERPGLTGALTARSCIGPELTAATTNGRVDHAGIHHGLWWPSDARGRPATEEENGSSEATRSVEVVRWCEKWQRGEMGVPLGAI